MIEIASSEIFAVVFVIGLSIVLWMGLDTIQNYKYVEKEWKEIHKIQRETDQLRDEAYRMTIAALSIRRTKQ